jgi:hypothetical protein
MFSNGNAHLHRELTGHRPDPRRLRLRLRWDVLCPQRVRREHRKPRPGTQERGR